MPYNGTGTFVRLYNWVTDTANGILVRSDRMDAEMDGMATALSDCLTRDGQSPPTANIPMGGYKITGLANGAAPTDAVNYGQVFTSGTFTTPTILGATATGTINLSGASTVTVPTVASTDNSTNAASTAYVKQVAFLTALPAQALGFCVSTGSVASFGVTHTGYAQNEVKGADIASASTINLTTATGNFVHVTGTTTITAITIPVGAERTVIFDGVLTLTHGAALLLPTAANIPTAANDRMIVRGDTAGAIVTSYTRASGDPVLAPSFKLLATLTPTVAANVDFLTTFTSAYDNYLITGNGITCSADDILTVRCATAGAADAGANYYTGAGYSPAVVTLTSTSIQLPPSVLAAGIGANFDIRIKNTNDATRLKTIVTELVSQTNATPGYGSVYAQSTYAAANTVSGFRLFFIGGANFGATGKVRVYGYNNT